MANTLQIKRGNKSSIPTLLSGELGFASDTQEVFIGTGSSNIRILTEDDQYTDSDVDSHLSSGPGLNYSTGLIELNFNSLDEQTTADGASDYLAFYDSSTGTHKKINPNNLVDAGTI